MEDARRDLSVVLAPFARERSQLLPALERVQAELGSLPLWALETVGEHLRVPKSELYGVATHFPELRLGRRSGHLVRVCVGLSCRVLGADEVLGVLSAELAARNGRDGVEDGAGTVRLETTACAFLCSVGPVIEIDHVAQTCPTAEGALDRLRPWLETWSQRERA